MKMKCSVCIALMIACVGLSQAVVVSWDATSADITSLGSNVNSTPNSWTATDTVWNTTDEVVPPIGNQASFKAAIGIIPGQRRIAQINAGGDQIFVGGNEPAPTGKAPYTTLVGFDTSAFGAGVLGSISMTLRSRVAGDSMDVRWFVEANGSTYVSDIVDTVAGAFVTLTTPDVSVIRWFTFDSDANIGDGISDANSLMELSNVTRVGYHTTSRFTADANWHGAFVTYFSAATIQLIAAEPDPADGALVLDDPILSWTAGDLANAHDVYLDTVNPPVAYMGRQTETSYDHEPNLPTGTYYWRIDEVDDPNIAVGDPENVWKGNVWSFEIADPGVAADPVPVDGATGIDATPTLSWTAGLDAISHDVWFGKSADALKLVSDDQAETTYAPGVLIKGETYYWAVDEYDGTSTYEGPVWSFTVAALGGTTNWTNDDPAGNLWTSEANWDNGVPGLGTQAYIHANGPALIDSSVEAVATGNWCRWGIPDTDPNTDDDAIVLEMTGGSLTVRRIALGNGGPAVVNMSDGTIATETILIGDHDGGDTTFNMNGGTVDISGTLNSKVNETSNSINLNGGVLTASTIVLNASSDPNMLGTIIDIAGGTLILAGDDTAVVNGYIDSGRINAYGGKGRILVDYDVTNPGQTTVTGCPFVLNADFNNNCAVDLDDLRQMASDWLFQTPSELVWSFDMATDPVGTGMFDLVVRGDNPDNAGYAMSDDTGTGTLEVTGVAGLLLDQNNTELPFVGTFDSRIHYVVKSTDSNWVNLWYTMATSASPGQQAYVGISTTSLASGVQAVEFWTSAPPHNSAYAPVVATGFSADAYLDITVDYDYETDTYAWTVTDGTTTQSGTGAYTAFGNGNGGNFTLQNASANHGGTTYDFGHALIDQMDITIYGSEWYSSSDTQLDGSVDLSDFATLAREWLLDGSL